MPAAGFLATSAASPDAAQRAALASWCAADPGPTAGVPASRWVPALRRSVTRCTASGTRYHLSRLSVLCEVGELPQNLGGAHQALFRRFPFLQKHHLHVRPHLGGVAVLADEIDQTVGLRELVVAEGDHRALRAGIDLLDIGAAAI